MDAEGDRAFTTGGYCHVHFTDEHTEAQGATPCPGHSLQTVELRFEPVLYSSRACAPRYFLSCPGHRGSCSGSTLSPGCVPSLPEPQFPVVSVIMPRASPAELGWTNEVVDVSTWAAAG